MIRGIRPLILSVLTRSLLPTPCGSSGDDGFSEEGQTACQKIALEDTALQMGTEDVIAVDVLLCLRLPKTRI